MPSPIGHALAGMAIAWFFVPKQANPPDQSRSAGAFIRSRRFVALCATLAAIPDLDLLYQRIHRTVTHSVTATLVVTILAIAVTGWVTSRVRWRIALACGVAYGSHVLLDWLGADSFIPYGIQALWPFSDRWFIAPWPIFPGTERRLPFSPRGIWMNTWAVVAETLILGSVALIAWRLRDPRGRSAPDPGKGD
jgi:membrane-bound metal-dependent hydrolase YbcI (DUF457 family)